eukprot:scaffold12182_cov69-Skeletonema_dohrnii-CCMP3373.AAC.3
MAISKTTQLQLAKLSQVVDGILCSLHGTNSGESERPAGLTDIEYDSNSNRHIRTQHHVG